MKSVTLQFREGGSDKVYQASIEPQGSLFVVNIAYGRRGSTLQTGTKTQSPVEWETATKVWNKVVQEKKAKGYTESESGTPYLHSDKQVSGIQCQLLNPIDEPQVNSLVNEEGWCLQEKFDGQRMLVQKKGAAIHGINRKGQICGLPSLVIHSAHAIPYDFIIDGECMGEKLMAFDLLDLDGKDCRQLPYSKRLVELFNLLASGQAPNLSFVLTMFSQQDKASFLKVLRERKAEGAVFKLLGAHYTPGRPNSGGSQLKYKFYATLSAVVAKVNPQRSVEVKLLYKDGWHSAGNVTIPPNHQVPSVGAVVEIRFLYAFRESGCLYQPTFLGPRTDLVPFDCVASQIKFKGGGDEEE